MVERTNWEAGAEAAKCQERRSSQFVSTGEDSWTLVLNEDLLKVRHNVVGFGSASIPSYECLVKQIPDGTVTLCCLTWNVNEKPSCVLSTIADFLSKKQSATALEDVVAIALQEIPTQSRFFHEESLRIIEESIEGTHYVYFSQRSMSNMLLVFIAKQHLRYAINNPTVQFVPCAKIAKPIRTKGSLGLCFRLYQRMFVIIASHFSHSSIQKRLQNYHKMVKCFRFSTLRSFNGCDDSIFAADVILWMGDLNFRVNRTTIALHEDDRMERLRHDELSNNIRQGKIFAEFNEAEISFAPTHKFQPGLAKYVPGRVPSYTDRVLYWAKNPHYVACSQYGSIDEITQSDHRPVFGSFQVLVINKPIPQRFFSLPRRRTATIS